MTNRLDHSLLNAVIPQVLDSGFNLDFIDADAIDSVGIPYHGLDFARPLIGLPLATYQKIEEYARHGGIVIAAHSLPSTAPGLIEAESEGRQIREISQRLFGASDAAGHFIPDETQLGTLLSQPFSPRMSFFLPRLLESGSSIASWRRGDLYFLVNTSNQSHHVQATFRHAAKHAEWWDPFTGEISAVENPSAVDIDLQPYESRVILFADSDAQHERRRPTPRVPSKTIDLTMGWSATFLETNQSVAMPKLHSWSEDPPFKYYSGRVSYTKAFDLSAEVLRSEITGVLDFGKGTPLEEPNPLPRFSMKAYFEGPVREAAEIYVNGKRAGFVWHPPYTIDVTGFLTVGRTACASLWVIPPSIRWLAGRFPLTGCLMKDMASGSHLKTWQTCNRFPREFWEVYS